MCLIENALPKKHHSRFGGFTLVELLVVIAIIGILIGLSIPAVQAMRASARRTACSNKIRQIALGALSFESVQGHFPAGVVGADTQPYPSASWLTQLLPFIEQQSAWDQAVVDYGQSASPWHGGHAGIKTPVSLFQCPSDPLASGLHWRRDNRQVALTSFVGVNGTDYHQNDGILFTDSNISTSDIRDGLSNTLLIGERPPGPDFTFGVWYAIHGHSRQGSPHVLLGVAEINDPPPAGIVTGLESCPGGPFSFERGQTEDPCSVMHFWSKHNSGALFAWADGTTRFLSYSVNDQIMIAAATRSGNETE